MAEPDLLQVLMDYGVFILILTAIGSLIPTLITKVLMSRIFGEDVSFWVLLGITVLVAFLTTLVIAYLGLFEELARDQVPTGPGLLLIFAAYLFQIAMFSAFVTNDELEIIPMWKWLVVLIAQAVLTFVICFLLVFLFILLIATV